MLASANNAPKMKKYQLFSLIPYGSFRAHIGKRGAGAVQGQFQPAA
jgi:hypothetical protein